MDVEGRRGGHCQNRPAPDCRYGDVCWGLRYVGKMVGKSRTEVRGGSEMGDKRLWRPKGRGWSREQRMPLRSVSHHL